jgi:hypothetical protein
MKKTEKAYKSTLMLKQEYADAETKQQQRKQEYRIYKWKYTNAETRVRWCGNKNNSSRNKSTEFIDESALTMKQEYTDAETKV